MVFEYQDFGTGRWQRLEWECELDALIQVPQAQTLCIDTGINALRPVRNMYVSLDYGGFR